MVAHRHHPTGVAIALCGIKFFYEKTLKYRWPIFNVVRPQAEKKLPVILSREEVREILARVRFPRYRTCLQTIYSCGLRLREGTELQVGHIDSRRMVIHLRRGKGNKDRYVPLPQVTLERLREYWKTHRNPTWIFPAPGRGNIHRFIATTPMPFCNVQDAFRLALRETGINKKATVHTLRHSGVYPALFAGPPICSRPASTFDRLRPQDSGEPRPSRHGGTPDHGAVYAFNRAGVPTNQRRHQ
jgi:integrase